MIFIFLKSRTLQKTNTIGTNFIGAKLAWTKFVWAEFIRIKLIWAKFSFILLILSSSLSHGMQANLERAFSSLGMAHNVTEEGGYQDQTGGFYTGEVFLQGRK